MRLCESPSVRINVGRRTSDSARRVAVLWGSDMRAGPRCELLKYDEAWRK
jgi:hypothetical protein